MLPARTARGSALHSRVHLGPLVVRNHPPLEDRVAVAFIAEAERLGGAVHERRACNLGCGREVIADEVVTDARPRGRQVLRRPTPRRQPVRRRGHRLPRADGPAWGPPRPGSGLRIHDSRAERRSARFGIQPPQEPLPRDPDRTVTIADPDSVNLAALDQTPDVRLAHARELRSLPDRDKHRCRKRQTFHCFQWSSGPTCASTAGRTWYRFWYLPHMI